MDLGQQPVDAIGHAGDLGCEVVVEADDHFQIGQRFIAGVDPPQGMRQRPCCFSDDIRVAGVGLGVTGVQVRDPPHRQPGQVGHVRPHIACDGNR